MSSFLGVSGASNQMLNSNSNEPASGRSLSRNLPATRSFANSSGNASSAPKRQKKIFTKEEKKEIEEIFNLFDTDGSGTMECAELSVVLWAMGFQPEPGETEEMVSAFFMCSLQEAHEMSISVEDFVDLMVEKLPTRDISLGLRQSFKLYDADNKGYIVIKDIKRICKEINESVSDQDLEIMMSHNQQPQEVRTLVNGFDFTPPATSYKIDSSVHIESLQVMDLDAYNYISSFLFEGMGTEEAEVQGMDMAQRTELFKGYLLQNARFFEVLKRPELLPTPTLKRLAISSVLLAIEELSAIRRDYQNEPELEDDAAENYLKNKRMAKSYERLVEFLAGDSLTVQEKDETIVISMIVEFKILHFLSDLAAGHFTDDQYQTYVTETARQNLENIVNVNISESQGFSKDAFSTLSHQLMLRRTQLFQAIDHGEVSLDSSISIQTEQTLLKCLVTIAINANTDMLPVLHPGYHAHSSNRIQQMARQTLLSLRHARSQNEKLDALGLALRNKKTATKSNRQRKPSSEGEFKIARKRKVWTDEETEALREGMEQYGNDWVTIQKYYGHILKERHPVSLKDRARSMRRILTREGKPLGVWENGSAP
ncbi:hypothetical protein HDV01_004958 [Terramyces sp. JEL0728]|nr:hypothetical protein HDV01_004958 [Terramyces sp. JEL0728]